MDCYLLVTPQSAQLFSPWRKCKAERMFACFEQMASKCSATNTNQLNPRDPNPCWLRSCFRKANQPTLCSGWISVLYQGFLGGPDSKESAYNTGDLASIPWLGKSPGEGNGNPLQYSCLENPMDGGAWRASVHGVTESRTWLCDATFTLSPVLKPLTAPVVLWTGVSSRCFIGWENRAFSLSFWYSVLYSAQFNDCPVSTFTHPFCIPFTS